MPPRRLGFAALAVAAVAASVWASGWHRFTWGARIGTFACAAALLGIGWAWRPRQSPTGGPPPPGRPAGRRAWLALIGLAVAWDLLALLTPPGVPHLTLSATEVAYRPLHALLFATWLAVGWVLVVTPARRHRRP